MDLAASNPSARRKAVWLMHLTVFLWGWTGVFGKWIDHSALQIVYVRCGIACIGLLVAALVMRRTLSPRTRDLPQYILTGLLILAHWTLFYLAIKLGSASVAAACMSMGAFFTAIISPFWTKQRISWVEVVLGVVIIGALVMIFGLEVEHRLGIILGTAAAFIAAWFALVNSRLVMRGEPLRISFYEMLTAMVGMGLFLGWSSELPPALWRMTAHDAIGHLVLGLVCTSLAFTLGIYVLKWVTPFTLGLTVNLEPVYTILIAVILWPESERMHPGSYLGIALILACITFNAWRQRRADGRKAGILLKA